MKVNLSKWALVNSKLVYYFIAILVIGGLLSYDSMSKLEDPAIRVKQAVVITTLPGASPHEIELQVTDPIEKALTSMGGVDILESRSSADLSIITVSLESTVPDSELEQNWDMLRRKVSDVQSSLPSSCSSSVVVDNYGDVFGMFYALTSDGLSAEEHSRYAELIQQSVLGVKGVSKVDIYGDLNPVINISIYKDKIANMGISPVEIINTISGQNKSVYSGYYNTSDQRIRVSVNDKYKTEEDLKNLVIQGHESDQLLLKDVALVERGYSVPTRNQMWFDNTPAIGISISANTNTDITKVGAEVEKVLAELKEHRLPSGIDYHKVFFQPERVTTAINTFLINLLESVVIVIVVLMFAMGIRSGILLGTTLVCTVLGSLLFLNMFDGTLQRVSLASFILAMGMLVDNAIVIVDGILIDMNKGRLSSKALTDIGRKTAMPLLGATLIAILAFYPVFLSPDTAGVYVRDLFLVLAVSLTLSWVLSLTMVPLQAKFMLKVPKKRVENSQHNAFRRGLDSLLMWTLRHRALTVILSLVTVVSSGFIYSALPQSFFPDMNYNQLYIEYKLPESSGHERTTRDLESITSYLLSDKSITHVTSTLGSTPSRYNLVRSIATPSITYGDLIVEYNSEKELIDAIPSLQQYLTDNYPQAYVRVKRYNLMYSKFPIEAMFSGPDPAVLRTLVDSASQIMKQSPNITLITSDWEDKVPYLEVDYNQQIARSIGVSRQDVALSLLASTEGIPSGTIYNGSQSEQLIIKCVDGDGSSVESLETAPIFSLMPSLRGLTKENIMDVITGSQSTADLLSTAFTTTPLSQAVNGINLKWEDPVIVRYNGVRAMRAQCNTVVSVGAEDARQEIVEQIEAIHLPEGYSLLWKGEYYAKSQSLKYLFANIPLSIVLMIAILIMLFKDYRKPLIIILCVPLLFFGALAGVWLSGKSFGFVAICGILGLIGMMIKNGVVLMDEINLQIASGKDGVSSLLDSAASRFRPVMMASLTTILGMIPLLPDDMFGSLAATIMGGLLFGTLITLIFIPVLYSIFFKIKIKGNK